jgi:IS5 family transposase
VLNRRDRNTGDLFDPWAHLGAARRRMLEQSWAGVFRKHALGVLVLPALNLGFHAEKGRPGKVPQVLLGVLVLQQMHDTTDVQTLEMLAFNEQWHYALNVRQEDEAYLCDKTLRNWRNRLIAQGLEKELFDKVTGALAKYYKVDASLQRIDSTRVCSNMAKLSRLELIVGTIEVFLNRLRAACPELWPRVEQRIIDRHLGRDGVKGVFALTRPSEAQRHLPEAAKDLLTLVRQFQATDAAVLEEFALLKRVLEEQCEVSANDDGPAGGSPLRVREDKEVSGASLQNPSDPDATYNAHKGQGYRVQIMETFSDQPADQPGVPAHVNLITHVSIGAMNEHDSAALAPAIEDASGRQLAPQTVLGDTHYGTRENCRQTQAIGVELFAPAQPPRDGEAKLSLEDFELDGQDRVTRCPQGHAPLSTSVKEKNKQAMFDRTICQGCPLRKSCPVQNPRSAGAKAMRLQYDQERLEMRQRRLKEKEPEFLNRYRWRAGIEGTMSRLKHVMGMVRLRVRTLAKVSYAVYLKTLGLNLFRCAAVGM